VIPYWLYIRRSKERLRYKKEQMKKQKTKDYDKLSSHVLILGRFFSPMDNHGKFMNKGSFRILDRWLHSSVENEIGPCGPNTLGHNHDYLQKKRLLSAA
jgi:hypothetical protein